MGQWLAKLVPCFPQPEKTDYKLFADDETWRLNDDQLLSQLEEPDGFRFGGGELSFHHHGQQRLPTFDVDADEVSVGHAAAGQRTGYNYESTGIRRRNGSFE